VCQLRVGGAARGWRHADEALTREVARGCLRCPPSCCGARGCEGRSQRVHVGRHRVVWEAWLSTRVHGGVPLHELNPGERLVSADLKGEVGVVVSRKPKTLLRWVRTQHGHDRLVREAPDECRPAAAVKALG
jgi:hypothetical protein